MRGFLLAAALAGCATTIDVSGSDYGVLFPALHASRRLSDEFSLDLDASHGSGDDRQTVGAGEVIRFDRQTFGAGSTVRADYELTVVSLAARWRWHSPDRVRVDGFAGLAVQYFDLTLASGGQRAHDTTTSAGPILGGRVSWAPAPRMEIYVEPSFVIGVASGDLTGLEAVDVGFRFAAADHFAAFLAWRYWSYREGRSGSDIDDLVLSGPVLGVGVDF